MFISFEGIEASGKSTVMRKLEHALRADGHDVVATREPGGTPVGDAVRDIFVHPGMALDPMTEMLLINASRAQLVRAVIVPALERAAIVLCDRYVHSTIAYQCYGRGLDRGMVVSVCEAATGGLMPNLTVLIDISYETSRARLHARGNGHDRLEREDHAFHQRVRNGYLEIAKHDARVVRIDGERSEEDVAEAALAAVSAVLA